MYPVNWPPADIIEQNTVRLDNINYKESFSVVCLA